ncbi:uncharacterized protein BJ171DRAFT_116197 [Polychytrium aggregatum]|uniref:uncharacterized protein n=1 Tax=Polychytrium aggregatum TaxID=110093 RepID=UPI0022FED221|nr:uncharacterized protein BJ171DRAFT_116197 [Polychytrium aggregatum]KAI9209359.1 hypothetical protein BJ171DRAFT_116197 [Polychytrium aggregatum]
MCTRVPIFYYYTVDGTNTAHKEYDYRPAYDVVERPDSYEIFVDLPGVKKGSISLSTEKDLLVLQGERTRIPTESAVPTTPSTDTNSGEPAATSTASAAHEEFVHVHDDPADATDTTDATDATGASTSRATQPAERKSVFLISKRSFGKFQLKLRFNQDANFETAVASLDEAGVLKIAIQKRAEAVSRPIPIR